MLQGVLAFRLLVSSADSICKQSGSKLFATLVVYPKEIFEKVDLEKNGQRLWHVKRCNIVSGNIFALYRNIYGLKIYVWTKNKYLFDIAIFWVQKYMYGLKYIYCVKEIIYCL